MMDLSYLTDWAGDRGAQALIGVGVGLLFGLFAQRSQFCLRAATIEFWRGPLGGRSAIWLLAFGAALFATQAVISLEWLDTGSVRQLNNPGTLSGAIIGGLLFGSGMILARGCASRLLVLSATGNLRALVAGMLLTVVAQASLRGILSPTREELSSWWVIDANARNLANLLPTYAGLVIGAVLLLLALWLCARSRLALWQGVAALGVGITVVLGWYFTYTLSLQSFEVIPVQSVSFTGPSADTLMALINTSHIPLSFDIGLVPGVFLGSLLGALLSGTFKIQGFDGSIGLPRYLIGAAMMGFGGMLAGGCAVGAGVTGGSVLALTAWVALLAMWLSAGLTDYLVDRRPAAVAPPLATPLKG